MQRGWRKRAKMDHLKYVNQNEDVKDRMALQVSTSSSRKKILEKYAKDFENGVYSKENDVMPVKANRKLSFFHGKTQKEIEKLKK